MFGYIDGFFSDPKGMLILFLLAFPGRILAISAHEYAHARMAYHCGDDTAYRAGRMTLNPLRHLDLVGTLMMLLLGFGWAKPVPVNPLRYHSYRRDDIKVSLAGIAMNFALFLLGVVLIYAALAAALGSMEVKGIWDVTGDGAYRVQYAGEMCVYAGGKLYSAADIVKNGLYLSDSFLSSLYGTAVSSLYSVLMYFTLTNLSLALFNLIPVPPLDGYHVLNDLALKRPLFARPQATQIAMGVMLLLMVTGVLGNGLSYVVNGALSGVGWVMRALFSAVGLI